VVDSGSAEVVTPGRTDATAVDDLAPVRQGVPELFSLAWVLHPMTTETYFRDHWEAQPFLISRADPDYFVELPGLDALDEIITTTASRAARSIDDGYMVRTDQNGARTERTIRLLDNGVPDIQDVYRAYHAGYSVIVNHVDQRSGPVARLCRTLESALHHRVGANMYLTPQGSQDFPVHIDDHDVLIVQLHGAKEWHVANSPSDLPLAGTKGGSIEFRGDEHTYTLAPGDTLYVPRGFPHEAVTASSSSLHLTIGIHVYTWADLLREALNLFAHERVEFRRALPPGFLNTSIESAQASKLASDLAGALAGNSLAERSKERLTSMLLGAGKIPDSGQFRSIDAIADLNGESSSMPRSGPSV
jgi:ribosomal protein L16 Arg81 hydroxylase